MWIVCAVFRSRGKLEPFKGRQKKKETILFGCTRYILYYFLVFVVERSRGKRIMLYTFIIQKFEIGHWFMSGSHLDRSVIRVTTILRTRGGTRCLQDLS